jgi:hypothetical protein
MAGSQLPGSRFWRMQGRYPDAIARPSFSYYNELY